jgi:hypothetical protein
MGPPDAQVGVLDATMVSCVQLCDGLGSGTAGGCSREGAFVRLPPGEGEFPLRVLIEKVAPDFPLSLEVPCE